MHCSLCYPVLRKRREVAEQEDYLPLACDADHMPSRADGCPCRDEKMLMLASKIDAKNRGKKRVEKARRDGREMETTRYVWTSVLNVSPRTGCEMGVYFWTFGGKRSEKCLHFSSTNSNDSKIVEQQQAVQLPVPVSTSSTVSSQWLQLFWLESSATDPTLTLSPFQ